MSIEAGRQLLHYRLVEKIGEGGMGVVWKAHDTSLNRDVAIKVLPETVSEDAERLARFDREAKLLASLNHPNIAAVYGLHEQDGVRFIAMELVPGEDLAQRLLTGPLSVAQAVATAQGSWRLPFAPRTTASSWAMLWNCSTFPSSFRPSPSLPMPGTSSCPERPVKRELSTGIT